MFNIVSPKTGSVAFASQTGVSLASVAGEMRESRAVRMDTMPSLQAAEASSEWMEWALSGRLGDFLGWTGQKFAEIGRDVFPAPSIAERRGSMQANKRALLQSLSEMLPEENAEEKKSLLFLQAYLRDVLVLLQSDNISHNRLKRELSQLLTQAEYAQQVTAVSILSEWLTNLNKITLPEDVLISEEKTQTKRELRSGVSASIDVSSLTGTDGFTLIGSGANTELGYSVHKLGDINGDKYDDFVVGGAPGANVAHIIFGSPTTFTALPSGVWDLSTPLTGTNGFTVMGEGSSDWFGTSVSSAGDINGDGKDDVIIGALYAPNGVGPGRAYVIFGAPTATFTALGGVRNLSTDPLTGSDGFTLAGVSNYDLFGSSVSAAGDINGDGKDDVIIGASYAPNGVGPGQAYVIFGASSFPALMDLSTPLTGSNGFTLAGVSDYDLFGASVSGAGDVDQDGYADVIVGAPDAVNSDNNKQGEATVIFGAATATFAGLNGNLDLATTALTGTNGFRINGINDNDQLGFSVSAAGDVNGDGFSDILVGAPNQFFGAGYTGRAYVIFGAPRATFEALPDAVLSPNLLTGPNGFAIAGMNGYDQLGYSVSEAGDVNGDGYGDMIVGAVNAPYSSTNPYPGQAYVIYGSPMSTFLKLPNAVLGVGTLTTTTGFTIKGISPEDKLGYSVSAAGDVNGDGVDDIIVGAPFVDTAFSDAGQAYVIFGVADNSGGGTATTGLTINANGLAIKQGERVLITTNELSANLAGASADSLLFTVSYGGQNGGSIHGYFENDTNQGTPIYQFTQADIEANKVNFVHNGGEYPPNYAINVCSGDASLPVKVKFHFSGNNRRDMHTSIAYPDNKHLSKQGASDSITIEDLSKSHKPGAEALTGGYKVASEHKAGTVKHVEGADDADSITSEHKEGPVLLAKAASAGTLKIVNNNIELKRGDKHQVSLSELSATGGSVSDDALKFTILNNYRRHEHGYFKRISQAGEVKQFTQADIRAGNIYFIHDRTDDKPNYAVSVSEAECTIPETVAVDFYDKHGKLVYSGRPAGASELRSDEGLMPVGEAAAVVEAEYPALSQSNSAVGSSTRVSTAGDAQLLSQAGFFGERASRANRPRIESHNVPQPNLRLGKVA